jgi:hypothetical protein
MPHLPTGAILAVGWVILAESTRLGPATIGRHTAANRHPRARPEDPDTHLIDLATVRHRLDGRIKSGHDEPATTTGPTLAGDIAPTTSDAAPGSCQTRV